MTTDIAHWPERFVYVCSAGGAANVNIAPMLHAGSDRIKGVVVLVALSAPNSPTHSDRSYAINPAARINDYARNVLRLPNDAIIIRTGNADLVADWTDALSQAERLAASIDAEIVFNVTGGRVAGKLGFMHALADHDGQPVSLISVGLSGFVVRRIEFLTNGSVREAPLPVAGRIGLENFMRSYGFEEHNPKKRARKEAASRAADLAVEATEGSLHKERAADALGALRAMIDDPETEGLPVTLWLEGWQLNALRPLFAALGGIEIAGNEVTIDDRASLCFLCGGWLEAMVFRAIETAFAGRDDLDIVANYELRRLGGTTVETEFDLMVFGNDLLALVECKAITSLKKKPRRQAFRTAINKLGNYRKELAGQGGGAFIVMPFLSNDTIRPLAEQARSASVRLLNGPDAVTQLVEELGRSFR